MGRRRAEEELRKRASKRAERVRFRGGISGRSREERWTEIGVGVEAKGGVGRGKTGEDGVRKWEKNMGKGRIGVMRDDRGGCREMGGHK